MLSASGACKQAVLAAVDLGKLLVEKKATLGHGNWLPWLATFGRFGEREAQNYLKLASNPQRVSDLLEVAPSLSIRKTLSLLAEDSEPMPTNPLATTSKVATVFQRVLRYADDDKLGSSEEAELLNYWEQLSVKLQRRGLLTDDLRPAQQLAV